MNAADIMTRHVITVAPTAPIAEAISVMLANHVSGLPVVDAAGALAGIVTQGDFLRRAELGTGKNHPRWLQFLRGNGQLAGEYVHLHGRHVADVMTPDVASVRDTAPLEEVVDGMERRRIRRLPVLDASGRLAGIVSRGDLLRALAECLPAGPAPEASDATLRDHVLAVLNQQRWAQDGRVTVSVTGGVARLEGIVFDPRARDAMRVAAENVPGITRVEDALDVVDPSIGVAGMP